MSDYFDNEEDDLIEVEEQDDLVDAPAVKPLEEIAEEVINGDWGSGPQRAIALQQAGYNYAAVMAEVNRSPNFD